MEAGGDFFIHKPIDTDLLFDYMKQAFAKYQQQ
jgi:FixJ family two-component response regulator